MAIKSLIKNAEAAVLLYCSLALASAAALAGSVDNDNLDRLEAASAYDQRKLARTLAKHLRDGRPSAEIAHRLVSFIVHSENLDKPEFATLLRELSPGSELSERTIIVAGSGLIPYGQNTHLTPTGLQFEFNPGMSKLAPVLPSARTARAR